jgi:hypothetical protein
MVRFEHAPLTLAAVSRARRRENGPPTPATNRTRIVRLEDEVEWLDRLVEQHEHALAIQLQRIAQLQADLDAIRAAWTGITTARLPRRMVPRDGARPRGLDPLKL